ncbi:30S ribosomal protein S19e [Candidatus Woesearchaeota archaeon]|nr:30S ribosomal protein S19e [Candidatus Woesearchaeota archaeon]
MADAKIEAAEQTKADPKEKINPLSGDPGKLIDFLAEELKSVQQIKAPAWAPFVKTGMHKERPPARKDWWHIRVASVLRTVANLGPVGTSKLRTRYGGKHSRGFKSERFAPGSGSIIRKALQQLEKAGLVKQAAKGVHKGRVITEKASALLKASATKAEKAAK